MAGLILDAVALIGFERKDPRTLTHLDLAQQRGKSSRSYCRQAGGARVLTSDFDDLDRLRSYFPTVRLLQT
jgi:hypothetical protein